MNKKTFITVLLVGIVTVLYFSKNHYFPNIPLTFEDPNILDSAIVSQGYVDFNEETIREEFISSEKFQGMQSYTLTISPGDSLIQSILGGSMEKDCVLGFIFQRKDHSVYTFFLHLPGDKRATWNQKTMSYKYRDKNFVVQLKNN